MPPRQRNIRHPQEQLDTQDTSDATDDEENTQGTQREPTSDASYTQQSTHGARQKQTRDMTTSPDTRRESLAPGDQTHYITDGDDEPSEYPYDRLTASEFAHYASEEYLDSLDRLERRHNVAKNRYDDEGHPSGAPPPAMFDPVFAVKKKFPSTSATRSIQNEMAQRTYFSSGQAMQDLETNASAHTRYDEQRTQSYNPPQRRYTRSTAAQLGPKKLKVQADNDDYTTAITDKPREESDDRTNTNDASRRDPQPRHTQSLAGPEQPDEIKNLPRRPATIADMEGPKTTNDPTNQDETNDYWEDSATYFPQNDGQDTLPTAHTSTPPPFEARTLRPTKLPDVSPD